MRIRKTGHICLDNLILAGKSGKFARVFLRISITANIDIANLAPWNYLCSMQP